MGVCNIDSYSPTETLSSTAMDAYTWSCMVCALIAADCLHQEAMPGTDDIVTSGDVRLSVLIEEYNPHIFA